MIVVGPCLWNHWIASVLRHTGPQQWLGPRYPFVLHAFYPLAIQGPNILYCAITHSVFVLFLPSKEKRDIACPWQFVLSRLSDSWLSTSRVEWIKWASETFWEEPVEVSVGRRSFSKRPVYCFTWYYFQAGILAFAFAWIARTHLLKQWFFTVNQWVLLQRFELWFEPVSVYCQRVLIGPTIWSSRRGILKKNSLQNFGPLLLFELILLKGTATTASQQ